MNRIYNFLQNLSEILTLTRYHDTFDEQVNDSYLKDFLLNEHKSL